MHERYSSDAGIDTDDDTLQLSCDGISGSDPEDSLIVSDIDTEDEESVV
jgi:hypothetical protein